LFRYAVAVGAAVPVLSPIGFAVLLALLALAGALRSRGLSSSG
jgi:hypothetical protein